MTLKPWVLLLESWVFHLPQLRLKIQEAIFRTQVKKQKSLSDPSTSSGLKGFNKYGSADAARPVCTPTAFGASGLPTSYYCKKKPLISERLFNKYGSADAAKPVCIPTAFGASDYLYFTSMQKKAS